MEVGLTSPHEWGWDWRRHQHTAVRTQGAKWREDGCHWCQTFWKFRFWEVLDSSSSWEENWVLKYQTIQHLLYLFKWLISWLIDMKDFGTCFGAQALVIILRHKCASRTFLGQRKFTIFNYSFKRQAFAWKLWLKIWAIQVGWTWSGKIQTNTSTAPLIARHGRRSAWYSDTLELRLEGGGCVKICNRDCRTVAVPSVAGNQKDWLGTEYQENNLKFTNNSSTYLVVITLKSWIDLTSIEPPVGNVLEHKFSLLRHVCI